MELTNTRPPALNLLLRYIPALDSLRHYSWRTASRDLMAGLTVATVAVPQAMAYATLAGVPPQYGLYTAIVMTAVGALLDSSRQLINGPTNAISIALLSALAVIPEEQRVSAAVPGRGARLDIGRIHEPRASRGPARQHRRTAGG